MASIRAIALGGVPKPEPAPKMAPVQKRTVGSGILDVLKRAEQVTHEIPERAKFDPFLPPPRKELGEFIVEYHEPGNHSWCIVERVYWDKRARIRARTRIVKDQSSGKLREVFIERIQGGAGDSGDGIYAAVRMHLREDLRRRSWDNYFNNY